LAQAKGKNEEDYLNFLIESGDKVIKTKKGYFDFLDALNIIKNYDFAFLKKSLKESMVDEVFALNNKDKISTVKNLFIKKKIEILPVIDELKVIGEIRAFDFLINSFSNPSKNKADFYNEKISDNILNTKIENIVNKKPLTIDISKTYLDAIDILINKKLSSIIVTNEEELYSIISYKEIFKFLKKNLNSEKYLIEYTGTTEIYDDEYDLIQNYSKKTMQKISKISDYNLLKVSLKVHGNKEGTHKKKLSVNLLLSYGNHVIHINKEMISGNLSKESNNKVKGKWNVPLMVQEALSVLEKKVKEEKRKK